MAAASSPSPALSATTSDASHAPSAAVPAPPFSAAFRSETPTKTLRGLNKPKCKVCGNVARSRCPFESCKSCCSRAQNPCHIHVLKANTTIPDKAPASSSPQFDHQSTETSSSGNSHRVASLRQLSNNFAQFNNVHITLRTKKPLTRKDAVATNEWRFAKLKEFKDRNIEVENEAFDRYMQNISLLEEVFSVNSNAEESIGDGSSISNHDMTTTEGDNGDMVSGLKLKLRSNPMRTSNFRKRIQQIVDQGLKKLKTCESADGDKEPSDQIELDMGPRKGENWRAARASALGDLIDKLNKARNEEDLQSCMEMKTQLFNELKSMSSSELEDTETTKKQTTKNDLETRKESQYLFPHLISTNEIDQETLSSVNAHFSSLEQIEGL
ncbi:putative transcription factor STY-LRP1 family [Rosa chinensis]|uniref:Putative transcription factor STY-LRP1 family n=1 Tax=Rosa chinensis TaxID=74649 RepID=A0A2P6P9J3_ROSCH|nr:uncharacterized protein LOC112180057 [Rosa chinensis]PRQ18604.1 putative transcription factor STY-LRP1 family [Rosa chinensis]